MHSELVAAEASLGIRLDNLRVAADRTAERVTDAQTAVHGYLTDALERYTRGIGLDILAFGSMARHEMVPGSDFDFLVVANQIVYDPRLIETCRRAARAALVAIGTPEPGASGLFGVMVGAPDIVNTIGLDQDTNKTLSRRILILQESLCLNKHNEYESLVSAILRRYLYDYEGEHIREPRVPRFLFNDVVRFWRTIAVDYQAKRWEEMEGTKWGLRYIKLRASRKWTFASTVISLFMPVISASPTDDGYLQAQFQMPALARLAQLHSYLPSGGQGQSALKDILEIADRFLGWQVDPSWRPAVKSVSSPTSDVVTPEFREARTATVRLQGALERLFLSPEPLGSDNHSLHDLTAKYMTF